MNFSGIGILDLEGSPIAEGWMEFIEQPHEPLVFWNFLNGVGVVPVRDKSDGNIPQHIWNQLDTECRKVWSRWSPESTR